MVSVLFLSKCVTCTTIHMLLLFFYKFFTRVKFSFTFLLIYLFTFLLGVRNRVRVTQSPKP